MIRRPRVTHTVKVNTAKERGIDGAATAVGEAKKLAHLGSSDWVSRKVRHQTIVVFDPLSAELALWALLPVFRHEAVIGDRNVSKHGSRKSLTTQNKGMGFIPELGYPIRY